MDESRDSLNEFISSETEDIVPSKTISSEFNLWFMILYWV